MQKKITLSVAILIILLVLSYAAAYLFSPSKEDLKIQVAAVSGGIQVEGNSAVKVFFSYELNKKSILSKDHTVIMEWDEDWQINGYNLEENGRYKKNDIVVTPSKFNGKIELSIGPNDHFDEKGSGEGYVILTPKNKDTLTNKVRSSVTVEYIFKSLVNEFRKVDSTSWKNENI
jgi:hypothetical protein